MLPFRCQHFELAGIGQKAAPAWIIPIVKGAKQGVNAQVSRVFEYALAAVAFFEFTFLQRSEVNAGVEVFCKQCRGLIVSEGDAQFKAGYTGLTDFQQD